MTVTSYHLHRRVDWQRMYNLLREIPDTPLLVPQLPYSVSCPLCRGKLGVYQDTIQQGQWLYCDDCRVGGDPIVIAAKAWGVGVEAAARRLLDDVTAEEVALYQRVTLGGYAKVEAFWSHARGHLMRSGDLRGMRLALGISPTVQGPNWEARGGRFLGGATRKELDAFVGYAEDAHSIFWGRMGGPGGSDPALARDMLVVPFQDLPGRISSFLFVRKTGRSGEDCTYYPFMPFQRGISRKPVPGVFGLDLLFAPPDYPGADLAITLLDPLLAARLLVKHWAEGPLVLPLTAVWPDSPPCPSLATGRRPVVWGHSPCWQLFRHAAAYDSRVTLCSARLEDVYRQTQRCRPKEWVERQVASARPWRDVLEEHLARVSAQEAESTLMRLELPRQVLKDFVDGCRASVRASLRDFYAAKCAFKEVTLGERLVSESKGCWWLGGKQTPLSDAVVRVEELIHMKGSGKTYCRGTVHFAGREIRFTEEKSALERKGWDWLADLLISEGAGVLTTCRGHNPPPLLAVATAFHKPAVRVGSERAGWDEHLPGFAFPEFAIKVGGEVEDNPAPWPRPVHGLQPALRMPRPQGLDPGPREFLCEYPQATLAWAVALCVIHNVLADAWGYQPYGVVLSGSAQAAGVKLAEMMGCPRCDVARCAHHNWQDRQYLADWKHGFPLVLEGMTGYSELWAKWLAGPKHNHVLTLQPLQSRLCTVYGGWLRIDANRPLEVSRHVLNAATQIVPNYLQCLAARSLATGPCGGQPLDRVAVDLAAWFAAQGGHARHVLAGEKLIVRDGGPQVADAFAEILCRLIGEGKFGFGRTGFVAKTPKREHRQPRLVYFPDGGGQVWVPQIGLQGLLHQRRLPPLDVGRVTQGLAEADALAGVREHDDQPGWLVREGWWDARLSAWRSRSPEEARA